jgi:AraC-like DNA-binding protein
MAHASASAHLPFEASAMPVSAMAADYDDGHFIEPHSHRRAQLLYAVQGVMLVQTQAGRWVVPPSRGVWLEAGVAHSVRMRGQVRMRTVFIDTDAAAQLPRGRCVLHNSPRLRELILAAVNIPLDYPRESRDGRLTRLLLDELHTVPVLPLYLPWPSDARLRSVCERLAAAPGDTTTIAGWARALAMSQATFHRRFLRHTGMSFGRWRQQARLLLALEHLARGEKIIAVAAEHGYASQSAFTAMFRRHFGVAPSLFYKGG